jgi:signal transduction histidine kinase
MPKSDASIYMLIIAGMIFSFLVGIALILFYTRYHRRLSEQQEKIRKAELEHQKELLHAIIQSQEDERKRIGQDLHDDAGSILAKLRILFNQIKPEFVGVNEETGYIKMNSLIDKAIDNIRNISHRLSPVTLEFFGFNDAIGELCDAAHEASGIEISVDTSGGQEIDAVPNLISLHLFRVFEELITNTLKHAAARKITLCFLTRENRLICTYHDNGRGFDMGAGKQGIGLYNISSRIAMIGGTYTIKSSPGNGMTVHLSVPLETSVLKNSNHEKDLYSYSR